MTQAELRDTIQSIRRKTTDAYNLAHRAASIPTGFDQPVQVLELMENRIQLREMIGSIEKDLDWLDRQFAEETVDV